MAYRVIATASGLLFRRRTCPVRRSSKHVTRPIATGAFTAPHRSNPTRREQPNVRSRWLEADTLPGRHTMETVRGMGEWASPAALMARAPSVRVRWSEDVGTADTAVGPPPEPEWDSADELDPADDLVCLHGFEPGFWSVKKSVAA